MVIEGAGTPRNLAEPTPAMSRSLAKLRSRLVVGMCANIPSARRWLICLIRIERNRNNYRFCSLDVCFAGIQVIL
jgi:hypothetical protein